MKIIDWDEYLLYDNNKMGSSQSAVHKTYNPNGSISDEYIDNRRVGWIKILDIFFENDKKIKIHATLDGELVSIFNDGLFLILRKNNVNYANIRSQMVKGASIYVETGVGNQSIFRWNNHNKYS